MDLRLEGRRAIVTGGSRGIGKAVARVLIAEGARVAVVARGEDELNAAAAELGALAAPADTGDDESVRAMVERVAGELGGIDILVNAAATPNTAGGFPDDALEAEINVKVRGYLRCVRAVVPHMDGWGRIVNVSGLAARQAGTITGSVRNVAVAAMTKNLADELGPRGINVTVVHPGLTRTERNADEEIDASGVIIGRIVTAAEVADVIAFLCSPRSVAISGDAVVAGGGARGPIHY